MDLYMDLDMDLYSSDRDADWDSYIVSDISPQRHSDQIKYAVDNLVQSCCPHNLIPNTTDVIDMDLWTQEMERRGFTIQQNWKMYPGKWESDEHYNDEDNCCSKLKKTSVWLHADQVQHVYCYILSKHQYDDRGDWMMMRLKAVDLSW
jgi:hypothetical protein